MTTLTLQDLQTKVESQRTILPGLYGKVDFAATPERFNDEPAPHAGASKRAVALRASAFADPEKVARMRAYTLLGDVVGDAYAALMPTYGFRRLISMLTQACREGVDAVPNAPPELTAFVLDMERSPEWVDMKLVEEGARLDRRAMGVASSFGIRGAFFLTFMNKYTALPMALTGALSNESAARRVRETATFFATSVLPGALERHGPGFLAAAMVRLMHSMVRFNALRSPTWDVSVYGIPIPQVDQMPAGLIGVPQLCARVLDQGRTEFTPQERARIELARYRCFLLGLPEDLLPDSPQAILEVMRLREQTLRRGFEDATCGELVRATLAADLKSKSGLFGWLSDAVEPSFSKVMFVQGILRGDAARGRAIGVKVSAVDKLIAAATAVILGGRRKLYEMATDIPALRGRADAALVRNIKRQLESWGRAEFTSDVSKYRPTHPADQVRAA